MTKREHFNKRDPSEESAWIRFLPFIGAGVLILGVLIFLFSPESHGWFVRGKIERVHKDMRKLATAIETYCVDNAYHPAWGRDKISVHAALPANQRAYRLPTFRATYSVNGCFSITSPIPYIKSLPIDPFASAEGATFGYYSWEIGWILWSPGPDKVYDVTRFNVVDFYELRKGWNPIVYSYFYDPTNGLYSAGDIIRLFQ